MNHIDVMKQALEALNFGIIEMNNCGCAKECMPLHYAAKALREALAAPTGSGFDEAAVERALVALAWHEDGAQWPEAYSQDEQKMEREKMREALAAPQPAPQQAPDALHLAAMDLARKQADRIAELEAEVTRFRADAMNEKSARQAVEQRLAAPKPSAEYQRIGTLYSKSWPIVECGWRFALGDLKCTGYAVERDVFVIGDK